MRPDSHEIYGRRRGRNIGLGVALGAFVLLVFAVTVVKLTIEHPLEVAPAQIGAGSGSVNGG